MRPKHTNMAFSYYNFYKTVTNTVLAVQLALCSLQINLCGNTTQQFFHNNGLVDKVVSTQLETLRDILL
jgi:hypothetical protein